MLVRGALLVGLAGCGAEPEIRGGTEEQREEVRQAWEEFTEAVESPPIIGKILFRNLDGHSGGYSRNQIWVDPEAQFVKVTTLHELCHAWQVQHDVAIDETDFWLADEAYRDSYPEERWTGEAFADTCEVGPESAWLLGEACPDDTDGAQAFTYLLDVFSMAPPLAPPPTWVEQGSLDLPGAALDLSVHPTVSSAVGFGATGPDGWRAVYVDVWTGAPAPVDWEPPPADPPAGPTDLEVLSSGAVDGDELLVVRGVAANGGQAERVVSRGPDGASRAGCRRPAEIAFAADGARWSAWADGDTVRWGTWVEE